MEDSVVLDTSAVGSGPNLHYWDKGKKNHTDWSSNTEKTIQNYLHQTIAKYSKTIKLKTDKPKAFYCRGTAKYQLDDYQGALDDLSKAIDLKPDFAHAYVNRAWAHFMLGKKADAIADLHRAQELGYPVVPEAFNRFQ
jgi:tetratricopeptide (TPR) repeat protein